MPDREKVINGLEICVDRVPGKYTCNKCPYEIDGNYCEINLTKDAIALLKEQEAEATIFYRCDPEKNKECKKRGCTKESNVFRCSCTSYPDYAVRDDKGNPIIAYIHFEDKGPLIANGGADW